MLHLLSQTKSIRIVFIVEICHVDTNAGNVE